MLSGHKVLVTGATGTVGLPVTLGLVHDNEVWALARFSEPSTRERLEQAGARTVAVDLVEPDMSAVPTDFTYVLNFSVMKTNDWGRDLDANAGGTAELMHHCRQATAFLHCSSTSVYQPDGHRVFKEDDPLGDNHRVWPMLASYSINKIAAEATARWCARHLRLPTVIARLNVPYGDPGCWPLMHLDAVIAGEPVPVHTDAPSVYNPIHNDDVLRTLPALLEAATVPATIVNWGGEDAVSIEQWSTYLGSLVGKEATFFPTELTIQSVSPDVTRMLELTGPLSVKWKDGFRRMVETHRRDRMI
jgi:UDP-glucuronate 4-epimerase